MKNEYLRHTLATIAYRFQKATPNTEVTFGDFSAGQGTRTPNEIINHMYHVLSAMRIYILEERYEQKFPEKLNLPLEIDRFKLELKKVDHVLTDRTLDVPYTKRLLQGPFSDILTHIGQLAMLSRLAGNPIEGENFSAASIVTGIT